MYRADTGFFFTARPALVSASGAGTYTAAFTVTAAGVYTLSAAADGVAFFHHPNNLIIVAAKAEPANTVLVRTHTVAIPAIRISRRHVQRVCFTRITLTLDIPPLTGDAISV
jgi:hypothetical protein